MKKRGILLPIAAPSGAGKTTVCRELIEKLDYCEFSISCTTRSPRANEQDGADYHFVTHEKFEEYIKKNQLIEYEEVFDNYYGTLKSTLEESIENGVVLLLDIDVNGALNIKKKYSKDTLSIFLKPPSLDELIRRLVNRGSETEESLKIRQARIPEELAMADQFDFVIVNDDLDKTVNQILTIIKEKK